MMQFYHDTVPGNLALSLAMVKCGHGLSLIPGKILNTSALVLHMSYVSTASSDSHLVLQVHLGPTREEHHIAGFF